MTYNITSGTPAKQAFSNRTKNRKPYLHRVDNSANDKATDMTLVDQQEFDGHIEEGLRLNTQAK